MKQKRNKVFVWITWIPKLLIGEQQCEWAAWFKAHYKYDKAPSDFDLTRWTIDHNQLVHRRRDELEEMGFKVFIEDQNQFYFDMPRSKDNPAITISGKADITAGKEDLGEGGSTLGCVEDCKTGNPRGSDQIQVILYMIILPLAIPKFHKTTFNGRVVYKTGKPLDILWCDVDEELKEMIWDMVRKIGGDEPLRKVPSRGECSHCDIPKEYCPERIEEK